MASIVRQVVRTTQPVGMVYRRPLVIQRRLLVIADEAAPPTTFLQDPILTVGVVPIVR